MDCFRQRPVNGAFKVSQEGRRSAASKDLSHFGETRTDSPEAEAVI